MKKLLLFVLAIGIGFSAFSQDGKHVARSTDAPMAKVLTEKAPQSVPGIMLSEKPSVNTDNLKSTNATYVSIGQSGNAYGFYSNPRTYLWADPSLNSIVFTHRMIGGVEVEGNSRISYDVSTDGGATWTTNTQVYTPTGPGPQYPESAGRYPQGAILNPEGNTDPANAYYTYLAATIINTNGIWGGYGYGSNMLTQTDPPNPSQVNLESVGGHYRLIPDAYTVTQQGVAWYVDGNYDNPDTYDYTGQLTLGKGEIVDGEIVFEESLMDFLDPLTGINDHKIAFAPDGQTGYIMIMTDANDVIPYTNYHPVLLKTTDGGDSWGDPMHCQFGGVDGIDNMKNYWSDEIMEELYGAGFNRDEVSYNMGFSADLIVDGKGNPHVVGIATPATDDGSWYPGNGTMATWHVYSDDGGTTWMGDALYDNLFFDGDIGGLGQWNRPYAASTVDGHYLFFSWIDTDLDGAEANTNPNIFVTGFDSEDHTYYNDGEIVNVTALSLYWFSAFYGSASQYVFSEEGDEMVDCELPFVFTEYTVPGDPASEMNFYYIKDFTLSMPVGVQNHETVDNFSVSQNTPNPATNGTSIMVTSKTAGVIDLRISNILGQVVHRESVNSSALAHTFRVDVSNLDSGIYFYTIEIGNTSVTKKMLVK